MAVDYANVALSCVVGMMSLPFCCMLGPQSAKSRLANWLTMMTSNLLIPIIDALLISVPCLILQLDVPLTQQIGRAFCMIVCCWGIQPARMWFTQAIGVHGSGALQAGGQFARAAQELWRDAKKKADDILDKNWMMRKNRIKKQMNRRLLQQLHKELRQMHYQTRIHMTLMERKVRELEVRMKLSRIRMRDNQNANVAPEVGNMLDNQIRDDVTDKAAELNEPEVTGQKDETATTEQSANETSTDFRKF